MKTIWKMVPGLAMALVIAAAAKGLEYLEGLAGLHLIGASVIALFIGMVINRFFKPNAVTSPGIRFTSKKVLKLAIILLGASLNIMTVLKVGRFSLTVMLFTLATCFGVGYFIGKALGLNWKMSNLISAGTGICGGSAIAAIAPVIDATDVDVAYGMSATFLFDMAMIVLFPILGRWLGLSDAAYGLWAGTAVNDTSSVVAAGYAFSEQAGDFATMVKLTRTLAIIPTVLIFALIGMHVKKKEAVGDPSAGQYEVRLPVVHPRLSRSVRREQPRLHPGLRRLRAQGHQQVSHGHGIGCHRPEHELLRHAQGGPEAHAARLYHLAARRAGRHCGRICHRCCTERHAALKVYKNPRCPAAGRREFFKRFVFPSTFRCGNVRRR